MRSAMGLAIGCGLAAALAVPAACADASAVDIAFKIRGDLQLSALQDGLGSKIMAMGMEATIPTAKGNLYCELGYQFKSGNQALANVGNMSVASGATINPAFSINSEKNKLEGVLLRLGYGRTLNTTWDWKAGLQFGGARFTNQAIGIVTDGSMDSDGNLNNASYLDTFAGTNSKTTLAISPYGSFVYHLDASSSFELGILLLNYKSFIYNHVAATETTNPANPASNYVWGGHDGADSYLQKDRLEPHFEFAYVFHF